MILTCVRIIIEIVRCSSHSVEICALLPKLYQKMRIISMLLKKDFSATLLTFDII